MNCVSVNCGCRFSFWKTPKPSSRLAGETYQRRGTSSDRKGSMTAKARGLARIYKRPSPARCKFGASEGGEPGVALFHSTNLRHEFVNGHTSQVRRQAAW